MEAALFIMVIKNSEASGRDWVEAGYWVDKSRGNDGFSKNQDLPYFCALFRK